MLKTSNQSIAMSRYSFASSVLLLTSVANAFVVGPKRRVSAGSIDSLNALPHVKVSGDRGKDLLELGFEPHEILPVYDPITISNFESYKEEYAASIGSNGRAKFWTKKATELLDWFSFPFSEHDADEAIRGSFVNGDVTFFAGAKVNACYNAIDRHVLNGNADKVALLYEGDEPGDVKTFTYGQLQQKVSQIANAMKASGIRKGDVVTIYMPMIPEVAMVMLACARIGAVHSVGKS